ncbi:MAG: hypothetical protein MJ231_06485 [bacterium]|nr:hypothetical protein [bacterium]
MISEEEKLILEKKFNWGAFLLSWIWGLLNKSYVTLVIIPISFIPVLGGLLSFFLSVFFGIKGNQWALRNKEFKSKLHFIKNQKIQSCFGILLNIWLLAFLFITNELSMLHPVGYDSGRTKLLIMIAFIILLLLSISIICVILSIYKQTEIDG